MDIQTGAVYVGIVLLSAVVIVLVSMFGIKEKSYEEAIAEQRKLPDDLLLGKKDKGKEKKHKNKSGKKVKEKKEEKEEKEDKPEHIQFVETPQILPSEPIVIQDSSKGGKKKSKVDKVKPILVNKDEPVVIAPDLCPLEPLSDEINHFDRIQPKDSLELRMRSRDIVHQVSQSEPVVNKSPKDTPTKSKKSVKEAGKKKDDNKDNKEPKEEKKEVVASASAPQQQIAKEVTKEVKETKEIKETKESKEVKEQPKDIKDAKEIPAKEVKELHEKKEVASTVQSTVKESKKAKKKNDILAQIGGDKDGVNVSLLMPLVQKAELSRSEIQILIDQLLNKQLDNPLEHSEWTEGRADPVIKLKKQLAEKEKALADEHEVSVAFQSKLKELRAELNAERSRLTASVRQLEEALNAKATEALTLHTRMQHILESHAAEKQGFARQIEQLQAKVNEDAAIIHKMQEDQGQTQGHMQQELIAQRKQLEVQFAQMRDNENALKAQLAQKHVEVQELQNVNMSVTQELQATCESSTAEIEMLRQQLAMMQEQLIHSEGQMQHFKETGDRLQDMARQLEESHRANADLDHRVKSTLRHEQDLQKQLNSVQSELNLAKAEVSDLASAKVELSKVQAESMKLKSELSATQNEAKSEAAEFTSLKNLIKVKEDELKQCQMELEQAKAEAQKSVAETSKVLAEFGALKEVLNQTKVQLTKAHDDIARLQEEKDKLSAQYGNMLELQKQVKQLHEENESLASQLAATTARPAAEGRENGIDEKIQKNNVELVEQANLLDQKNKQLDALNVELRMKESELSKLHEQIEVLQRDVRSQTWIAKGLQDKLEAQQTKNNELRIKNWKVMEALSAAEARAKSNTGKNIDETTQKIKAEEQESAKALLQRIFPDIKVTETSHNKWVTAFEERVYAALNELRKKNEPDINLEMEKQNKNLQGMVSHYKQIINDTEGMLNELQTHIESEETRWQGQIRQKENEIANLRVELSDLRNKLVESEKFQKKIVELESRLAEQESLKEEAKVGLLALSSTQKPGQVANQDLHAVEQLQEERARLTDALQTESNKRATLDAEVIKLRSLVETSESCLAQEKNLVSQLRQEVSQLKSEVCGGSSSSGQSTFNGPPESDSTKSEGGSGKK
ncbi:kinectin isoform X1 [Orussus abietinus]|uniref:kinectin isoform X1 n=1 Tax=Orussus abietinus TaxID=222816 RepID=UPI000625C172|nr:kinectin isoform X1 [Orussus abietinus]